MLMSTMFLKMDITIRRSSNAIELVDGTGLSSLCRRYHRRTDLSAKAAATAVKTIVDTGGATPTGWTLQLSMQRRQPSASLLRDGMFVAFSPGVLDR